MDKLMRDVAIKPEHVKSDEQDLPLNWAGGSDFRRPEFTFDSIDENRLIQYLPTYILAFLMLISSQKRTSLFIISKWSTPLGWYSEVLMGSIRMQPSLYSSSYFLCKMYA
jgi:hypothetical protein